MNILITGGTGFIGAALVPALRDAGHTVTVFTRSAGHADADGLRHVTTLEAIDSAEYFDAFINLAGESIAGGRWSEARKQVLIDSRIGTTQQLFALASRLERPPAILLSASAIGWYGPQDDTPLDEDAATEDCFSHRLCRDWEAEAGRFEALGTRVCILRLGVVLGQGGGALEELKKSVMFGVATYMGSGTQWLSWVHRDDVVAAMLYLLAQDGLRGPFNLTAPEPVTNRGFTEALRRHRTGFVMLPVPGAVMRLAMGELADELLLTGQRVLPRKLESAGFGFSYPTLAEALPNLLAS